MLTLFTPAPVKKPRGLASRIKDQVKRYFFPDYMLARRQYYFRNGFYPDLDSPKDLSEKILWLKLYDRSPLHTLCADKIRARDHVAARIGPEFLVPKILSSYDFDVVTQTKIHDESFVIKSNHDQGGVFICTNRATFDWEGARVALRARARKNKYYEYQERQYRDIRPGVLVENFIAGEEGRGPVELKVNCFEGKPRFIQAIVDRFEKRRHVNYDLDWRRMDLHGRSPGLEYDLPRPERLDRILQAAEILAEPFLFCRVDFLIGADARPWFGEMTFHPAAGLVRYNPPEMERALGEFIDLGRFDEFRRRQNRVLAETTAGQGLLRGVLGDALRRTAACQARRPGSQ